MRLLRGAAQFVLLLEWPLLFILVAAFWFGEMNRVWALVVVPPLLLARLVVYRRLWYSTPLDLPLLLLLALCVLNVFIAPYRRGLTLLWSPSGIIQVSYDVIVLGRLIMGVILATSIIDRVVRTKSLREPIILSVGLALLVGTLGLTAAQWSEKSLQLTFITQYIPRWINFPGAEGGFNVNEIAGAMAWLTPLVAALMVYAWRTTGSSWALHLLRVSTTIASFLLWSAIFLGQSRLTIIGVLAAFGVIAILLIPRGRWRYAVFAFIAFFAVAQLAILTGGGGAQPELAERDADSTIARVLIYRASFDAILDFPLTGLGLNTFRAPNVRADYPVAGYEQRVLPHAHNEWLQVTLDAGLPALLVFIALHVVLAVMLLRVWRVGGALTRAVAVGLACGLLAHGVFGMGDAITLWDRFTFAYWWMVGCVAAQYAITVVQPVVAQESLLKKGEVVVAQ